MSTKASKLIKPSPDKSPLANLDSLGIKTPLANLDSLGTEGRTKTLLANLDSLGIKCRLTKDTLSRIVGAGFRVDSNALAAILCQEAATLHPITLRGLFYRVVSTGFLPSTDKEYYDRVGRMVTRLRRKGLIPYDWIVDSVRSTDKPSSWSGLGDFAETVRRAYRKDFWKHMPCYIHVFTEKDAIAGVIQPVTREYDVRLSPIRGYTSESFVWGIADQWKRIEKPIFAAYLGDYDPSGFDIERDLRAKLADLSGRDFEWVRLGVNKADFIEYDLVRLKPKKNDNRFAKFQVKHGNDCAEIDALPPNKIRELVRGFIEDHIPQDEWQRLKDIEAIETESFQALLSSVGGDE
jgi:hypothetical protein